MKNTLTLSDGRIIAAEVPGDLVPTITEEQRTTITGPDGNQYPVKHATTGKILTRFEDGKPVYATDAPAAPAGTPAT